MIFIIILLPSCSVHPHSRATKTVATSINSFPCLLAAHSMVLSPFCLGNRFGRIHKKCKRQRQSRGNLVMHRSTPGKIVQLDALLQLDRADKNAKVMKTHFMWKWHRDASKDGYQCQVGHAQSQDHSSSPGHVPCWLAQKDGQRHVKSISNIRKVPQSIQRLHAFNCQAASIVQLRMRIRATLLISATEKPRIQAQNV